MSEKQLQQQIVVWFSQTFPDMRGHLFAVDNDTHNIKQAMAKRGMGMISGVSDLIYFSPITGILNGIEVKAPNTRHDTAHLLNQIEWGKLVYNSGGAYIMSADIEHIKRFIQNPSGFIVPNIDFTKKTYKFDT